MAVTVVIRPGFEADALRSPEVRAACVAAGAEAAREAERIGQEVSPNYRAEAHLTEEGARIEADTKPLGAAGWIEAGTATLPARAPLRRGAEAAGLHAGVAQ